MDEPALLSLALSPKTDADRERLTLGLRKLMAEDPSLRLQDSLSTGEVVIAATGELHLEIVVDRLKREFDVEAGVGRPQVAYREAFTRSAEGEMKYFSSGRRTTQLPRREVPEWPSRNRGTSRPIEEAT